VSGEPTGRTGAPARDRWSRTSCPAGTAHASSDLGRAVRGGSCGQTDPKGRPRRPRRRGDRMGSALVLGGGGTAALAWHGAVLTALARSGVDLTGLDRIVGTSAGAIVAARLMRGVPAAWLAADLRRARTLFPAGTGGHDGAVWAELLRAPGGRTAMLRRVGALPAPPGAARRGAGLAARLQSWIGGAPWPVTPQIRIPVIDADTGETVVLGTGADADPVTALRATCAVPGMLPAVPVAGRRCYDGGVGTPTHADLAAGCDRVLVLAPFG